MFWGPNQTRPQPAEIRWVRVSWQDKLRDGPLDVGQKCWFLYEPAYPFVNGHDYDGVPEQLDLCAVIEIEVLEARLPQRRRERDAWIQSRCIRVVPLAQIPDVFPPIAPFGKRATQLDAVVGRTVTMYTKSLHGYSEWSIVTNTATSRHAFPRLVLVGDDNGCAIVNCIVESDKNHWTLA